MAEPAADGGDQAGTARGGELWHGAAFLFAAVLAWAMARIDARLLAPRLSDQLASLSLIGAAAFLGAALTAIARRRGPPSLRSPAASGREPRWPALRPARRLADRLRLRAAQQDWRGDWLPIIVTAALSLASLVAALHGWREPARAIPLLAGQLTAAALLTVAFLLLVVERRYAALSGQVLPEAAALARIVRAPLLGVLGLAVAAGLRGLGLALAPWIEDAVTLVAALVAAELLLRSLAFLFVPLPPLANRRSHADSILARAIQARLPDPAAIRAVVHAGVGIDLARSWALRFIARAAAPLIAAMIVVGWLLSGVTAVGTGERAVYEAFGRPSAVLRSGLHFHLPWPFGVVRLVKFGAVREAAISFDADDHGAAGAAAGSASDVIDGDPRPEDDRLWDNVHPDESLYLVAAKADGGAQSFEVMGVDMDVLYRVGVTDAAAMQSIYTIEAPEMLVRSLSSQILVRYFAGSTLDGVLGRDRQAFVQQFQAELQRELTSLSSGIEVLSVVVEAIHPPPNAATAYQGVQAAAVRSAIKVNMARAEAVREMKVAAQVAASTRNDALAAAAARVGGAKADLALFAGDRQAYAIGGPSFLLERRLSRVARVLADKPVVILDHRVPRAMAPTLDMRGERAPAGAAFGDSEAD